ncbi:DEAD/DEAH box helicase family protein [Corynebacterium sp. CCUG 69979]|uniref:DEAD/DEAH box helicase family protein n=1 Tax=Corynebacterium sp. CCUG 69979 TaxID=2823890 RepID=UPI00210ACCA6|nr:DEAD/DEAH box helicase family protein [Corynebacterium sp. CCUG 69979]
MAKKRKQKRNDNQMQLFEILADSSGEIPRSTPQQSATSPTFQPDTGQSWETIPDQPQGSGDNDTSAPSNSEHQSDRAAAAFDPGMRLAMPRTPRARAEANIAALETLNTLERENRFATTEEQHVLARYSSWGAASAVFNRQDTSFADLRERLAAATTDEQYRRMEESTLTAFFTGEDVIRPLWGALSAAGYETGPVLEPGSGTGNFLGHAPDTANAVGVEIDPTAARIAQHLYPEAQIINTGFEKFQPRDNSFAAAIGNVPFGDFQLFDPQHNPQSHSIHNHFIIKSINLVQPGGYVALVTSSYTADSLSSAARQDMIARADLVTAARLPAGTFSSVAGTEVGTDVLVFRKREAGKEPSALSERFIETDRFEVTGSDPLRVNGVFADNPDAILGTPSVGQDRFGNPFLKVTARDGESLEQRLEAHLAHAVAVAVAEHGRMLSGETTVDEIVESAEDREEVLPGTIRYTRDNGSISFQKFDSGEWVDLTRPRGVDATEWAALLDMRDAVVSLYDAYAQGADPTALQDTFNAQYDAYLATYGPMNRFKDAPPKSPSATQQETRYRQLVAEWRADTGEPANVDPPLDTELQLREQSAAPIAPDRKLRPHIGALRQDPHMQTLLASEIFDESTLEHHKGRIFTGNPVPPPHVVDHVDSIADGVNVSLHRFGVIDPVFIAELSNNTAEDVEEILVSEGHAFRDPANPNTFIRSELYLSGVVKDKLADAMHVARNDERFKANVEALTEVLPKRISEGIDIRPGATWIDQSFYRQFITDTFGIPDNRFDLQHFNDQWTIEVDRDWWADNGAAADAKYGVVAAYNVDRNPNYNFQAQNPIAHQFRNQGAATTRNDGTVFSAVDMFQAVLNVSSPTVNYSKEWRDAYPESPTVHKEATDFAQRRSTVLRQDFASWVSADETRWNAIVDAYNDRFNSYVPTKWRPRTTDVPGLGENFKPYSYQLSAVERMINEPAVLLNHTVGAGKTGTFLMGAAELKRLGRISQPWLVVPNHLAEQIAKEANEWYPGAKVLSGAGLKSPEERRQFIAQSASAEWDFVVVPESVFTKIPVSKERELEYLNTQLNELKADLEAVQTSSDGKAATVKQIQRTLKAHEARIEKVIARPRDVGMEFESTRCDYLIVDEAHHYKNRFRSSRIEDISHPGSVRAADLDLKLQLLRERTERNDGHNNPVVTFATGTPLANNLAEIWVMAQYLRPDLLARANVNGINAWAATFTDQITMAEVPPQGIGLRSKTRTAKFINVGDLVTLVEPFMDVVTREQIEVPLPTRSTGDNNRVIEFDLGQEERDFIQDISDRADIDWASVVPDGNPAAIDLALKQLSDGQKVSMDPRLVNLDYEGFSPRVVAVADELTRIWNETKDNVYTDKHGNESPERGGLQIVFLDQATPKGDGSFNLYDEIRAACAERGMDPGRIEFIHDHNDSRDSLFERCRNGQVDVIIGSTPKLGTGANIQTRAVALHHVDVPWRPADLEQREGRIIRQGNQNPEVEICNYIARGSTDAVRWQTILRKLQTINQFLNADRTMRSMDPLESSSEEIAAQNRAAATGDPRYFDLMALNREVDDLAGRYEEWKASRESTELTRHHYETVINKFERFLDQAGPLVEQAHTWSESEDKSWTLPGQPPTSDRAEATGKMVSTLRDVLASHDSTTQVPLVSIAGIEFQATYTPLNSSASITPANLKVPTEALAQRLSISTSDLGLPTFDGPPNSGEYGAMRRVENFVKNLPHLVDTVDEQLTKTRIKASQLASPEDEATFLHADRLREITARRDLLEDTLSKIDQSAAAQQERQQRASRYAELGREVGWSLRLNPTKAYAEEVEGTTPSELVRSVKVQELDMRLHNESIGAVDYVKRKAELNGTSITDPANRPAPEQITAPERLALQSFLSEFQDASVTEHETHNDHLQKETDTPEL